MNSRKLLQQAFGLTLAVFLLAGCGGAIESIQDSPVHPQAVPEEGIPLHVIIAGLPWDVIEGTITDGPYDGYAVEGPLLYSIAEEPDPDIETFYTTNLKGWNKENDPVNPTNDMMDITCYVWTRGNRAFVAVTHGETLETYLLTK